MSSSVLFNRFSIRFGDKTVEYATGINIDENTETTIFRMECYDFIPEKGVAVIEYGDEIIASINYSCQVRSGFHQLNNMNDKYVLQIKTDLTEGGMLLKRVYVHVHCIVLSTEEQTALYDAVVASQIPAVQSSSQPMRAPVQTFDAVSSITIHL
jgi:hypothetical protein